MLINRVESGNDGVFHIPIEPEHQTFTMVVCRAGYFPRVEEGVLNLGRTQHVSPLPVEIVSYYATPDELEAVVEAKLNRLESDMRYLGGIEGGAAAIGVVVDRLVARAEEEGRSTWAAALRALRDTFLDAEGREAEGVSMDGETATMTPRTRGGVAR